MTVVLALSIIEAAGRAAQSGPVPRTNALRLALAYLFERSGGRDRKPFDEFWRVCGDRVEGRSFCHGNSYRAAMVVPAQHRIWCALGIPPDAEFSDRLARARLLEQRELTGSGDAQPVMP